MADKRRPGSSEMVVCVNLYTRVGELVQAVPTVTFLMRPEILVWGDRLFTWSPEHEQYREGLPAVLKVTPAPGWAPSNYYDDIQREQRA